MVRKDSELIDFAFVWVTSDAVTIGREHTNVSCGAKT